MDPRIKRIAFLLPPVIIAGVWFDFIPIAPGLRNKFASLKENKTQVRRALPIITKFTGNVSFRERPALPVEAVKGGETVYEGSSLLTEEGSSVLVTFQDTDTWSLRIAPGSQVNFDKIADDSTIFHLVHGGTIFTVRNHTGRQRRLSIRTKFASYTTSDATFAVSSDAEKWSLLTVKQGTVEAENFKLMEKSQVHEGFNYLVNREGEKKLELELATIDLFNWDLSSNESKFPAIEDVIPKFSENISAVPDDREKLHLEKLREIDKVLADFRTEHSELMREKEILTDNARESREGLTTERRKVDKDIQCLQTSVSECNLFSEKILLLRGFPRTWGNPRYRSGVVVGLQKYIQEREEEVKAREEEARILTELMGRRDSALNVAEAQRSKQENLDAIIPSLQDARLKR